MSIRWTQDKMTWLVDQYLTAKDAIIERGFAAEVDWQTTVSFQSITESDFLREASWVILSAGMSEAVVRRCFPAVSAAFNNWSGAATIARHSETCRSAALSAFAHTGKISAIIALARKVDSEGFDEVKRNIGIRGVKYLQGFEYVGPVTCFHLAKNLGLDVVKPDRHLVRLATATESESPLLLCRAISKATGDRLSVVDLVLWRFATIQPDYIACFSSPVMQKAA